MDFFHASVVSRPMMNDTTRRQTIDVKSSEPDCLFIWATQMSILTGLPSKIKCSVGFLFIRHLSSSQRHITWTDKMIINDEAEGIKKTEVTFLKGYTGRSRFTPGLSSWKASRKSNKKFPFKTVYFLKVRRLSTSSCIVYDYTTSEYMTLQITYLLCIKYIYISIQCILISTNMMMKLGRFGQQMRNTWKVLKRGAGEG